MATIVKRKNGTYGVKYTLDGKSKWGGTCKTEKEAKKLKRKLETEIENGTFIEPSQATVKEFALEWIEIHGKSHWNSSTYDSTRGIIKKHIISEIGHMKISNVTPKDIEMMFSRLSDKKVDNAMTKNIPIQDRKLLSKTMLRYIHNLTKQIFDKAVQWEMIQSNPVKIEAPKRDTPEQSFWSADEALIALQAISDKKLHLAVHLAFACSLRVGEVLGLTWDCISMDDLTIRIDKVLQRIKTEAYEKTKKDEIYKVFRVKEDNSSSILVLKDPKTAKSRRSLYMTKPLRDELMLMRKDVERNKAYYGEMYEDHNLVFALEDGTPIESHLCTKWFRKWQRVNNEELGLPYIKFHGLRHSSTTYKLRLSNGNIKAVQADTGHSTAKMVTDTYGHSESKEQYKLTQAFEHNFYSGGNDTGADRADEFIQNIERLDMDSSSMESDQLKNYLKLLFKKNPQFQKEVLDEMFSLDGPDFESSILGSTHKNITAK